MSTTIDAAIIKALVEHVGGDSSGIPDGTIGGGGATYTATKPLDITDDVISLKYNNYDFTLSNSELRLNYHGYKLATESAEDAKYWTQMYQGTQGYYLGLSLNDIQNGYLYVKNSSGYSHKFYTIARDPTGIYLWRPVSKDVLYLKIDNSTQHIYLPNAFFGLYQEPTRGGSYGWYISQDGSTSDDHKRYREYYELLSTMGVEFNKIGA